MDMVVDQWSGLEGEEIVLSSTEDEITEEAVVKKSEVVKTVVSTALGVLIFSGIWVLVDASPEADADERFSLSVV